MKIRSSLSGDSPEDKICHKFGKKLIVPRQWWLGTGGIVLLSLGSILAYGWWYGQRELPNKIEAALEDFLNRPVKLGELKYLGFRRVNFGKTEILSTSNDPANASLKELEIVYDPIILLTQRKLNIEVTAIDPILYLQQGKSQEWLLTPFDKLDENYPIQLKKLRWKKAQASLEIRHPQGELESPLILQHSTGELNIIEQGKWLNFQLTSNLEQGKLKVTGVFTEADESLKLTVQGQKLPVKEVNKLASLPLELSQGTVNANLEIKSFPDQFLHLQGIASLNQVTASLPQFPQSLHHIQGRLLFRGQTIILDDLQANLDKIKGTIQGTFHAEKGLDITAETQATPLLTLLQSLDISPPSFPLKGKVKSLITIQGNPNHPAITLEAKATQPLRIDQWNINKFTTYLRLKDTQLLVDKLTILPQLGGKIVGSGKIDLEKRDKDKKIELHPSFYQFNLSLQDLPVSKILENYEQNLGIPMERISGNTQISGYFNQENSLIAKGNAEAKIDKETIIIEQFSYHNTTWNAHLSTYHLPLNLFAEYLPETLQKGKLTSQIILTGNTENLSVENIRAKGQAEIKLGEGKIGVNNFNLQQGQWQGNLTANQLNTQYFIQGISPQFQGTLQGNFAAKGTVNNPWNTLQGNGQGQLNLSSGLLHINYFNITQGHWQTRLQTQKLNLKTLIPDLPWQSTFSGQSYFRGKIDNILESLQGESQGYLSFSQGKVAISSLTLNQGNFAAKLQPTALSLSQFSPQLSGELDGNLSVLGNIYNLHLSAIKAQGNVTLSAGIPLFSQPLTTAFHWQDQQLRLEELKSDKIKARGTIGWNTDLLNDNLINAIDSLNLQVTAQAIDIKKLPLSLPVDNLEYEGKLNFEGTITGNLQTPLINGDLSLVNFNLPALTFETVLKGTIQTNHNETQLNLAGQNDKLGIELDPQFQPISFSVEHQNLQLSGRKKDNHFYIDSQNLPLSLLYHWTPPSYNLFPENLTGKVSGNFAINLRNLAIIGKNIQVDQPQFNWLQAEKLTGSFHYLDGQLNIQESQLQIKNSLYHIQGNWNLNAVTPTFNAEIAISQGNIEDILETLHFFEIDDLKRGISPPIYHKAKDLSPDSSQPLTEIGHSFSSLEEQIAYFNEKIEQIRENTEKNTSSMGFIPRLQHLNGKIAGKIKLDASETLGLQADFQLGGETWTWGNWQIDRFQTIGNWCNGTLNLQKMQVNAENSYLSLVGRFTEQDQQGQLRMVNVPLSPLKSLTHIPQLLELEGYLNTDLEIGGNRHNPLSKGIITLNNVKINQTYLRQIQGNFLYRNARFTFNVNSQLGNKDESVTITGYFPYQLPFATIKPQNQEFFFGLNVNDEGLTLLNLITQEQLIWKGGTGDINLTLMGQIDAKTQEISHLQGEGRMEISNATLESPVIPNKPLTHLNGLIDFNLERIHVQSLTGQLSGGQVAIAGSLPLLQSTPQKQPLTALFNHSDFKLSNFYQGGVNGHIQLTGSVLNPQIGGKIELYQGAIFLNDPGLGNPQTPPPTRNDTQFNQLQIVLGDKIRVVNAPILNFIATGNLILNGTLHNPNPEGQIYLKGGQINLLASQLYLAGDQNTVQFFPEKGLDPYLNLNLVTSATETTRNIVRLDGNSSEITDPFTANRESLQTVRIQAMVKGFASQLNQSIALKSSPQRSEREILVLLGGGLANLGDQEDTPVNLANLAGSAVLGTVQGQIGSALGLNELRIFPTQLINEKDRSQDSQWGIAAEAGVDVTPNLSLSILKVLTSDRPPQWGLRYRVNPNLLLRGSSNFDDDSRGTIEYEHRF